MRSLTLVAVLGVSLACAVCQAAGWETKLDSLLQVPRGLEGDRLLSSIVLLDPPWRDVVARLEAITFPKAGAGVVALREAACVDSVVRPWAVCVPSSYEPAVPTPLLVVLHGGVSRAETYDDPLAYAQESFFSEFGEERGWLVLFPFGQAGATWWDDIGMANIRDLVRLAKREYNVDDDRVWMGGFSDGASASFLHAMVAPNDYAAFLALNGHMGVGSLDGELPTYAPNLFNTPLYAVTTYADELYPSERMRPTIEMARRAGADIFYRELEGSHDAAYASSEAPLLARFLERHARDPFPSRIVWEAAEVRFGLCRWFAIDRVTIGEAAPWHVDFNSSLVDDRVTIGFMRDDSYEGIGVKVTNLVEGDYPAGRMGLESGDVVLAAGSMTIGDIDDLNDFKSTVKRGDPIELTVLRGGEKLTLRGVIPEPTNYYVFKRDRPSALARVSFSHNRVEIQSSRVGAFRILVHPDMIRLDRNLVVSVDGAVVYDAPVQADLAFLLRNFLENRDRVLVYVAEVKIELKAARS